MQFSPNGRQLLVHYTVGSFASSSVMGLVELDWSEQGSAYARWMARPLESVGSPRFLNEETLVYFRQGEELGAMRWVSSSEGLLDPRDQLSMVFGKLTSLNLVDMQEQGLAEGPVPASTTEEWQEALFGSPGGLRLLRDGFYFDLYNASNLCADREAVDELSRRYDEALRSSMVIYPAEPADGMCNYSVDLFDSRRDGTFVQTTDLGELWRHGERDLIDGREFTARHDAIRQLIEFSNQLALTPTNFRRAFGRSAFAVGTGVNPTTAVIAVCTYAGECQNHSIELANAERWPVQYEPIHGEAD